MSRSGQIWPRSRGALLLRGQWLPSAAYSIDDLVFSGGIAYRCILPVAAPTLGPGVFNQGATVRVPPIAALASGILVVGTLATQQQPDNWAGSSSSWFMDVYQFDMSVSGTLNLTHTGAAVQTYKADGVTAWDTGLNPGTHNAFDTFATGAHWYLVLAAATAVSYSFTLTNNAGTIGGSANTAPASDTTHWAATGV